MNRAKKFLALFLAALMIFSMSAFAEGSTGSAAPDDVDGELIFDYEEELQYAQKFWITRYKGGYTMFGVPEGRDAQYLLVPEGKSVPAELPENTIVLQQPINRIRMTAGGMVSLVDAIGGLDNIASVATDVSGWYLENVLEKLNAGEIEFSGRYSEPDYEMLLSECVQLDIDSTMILTHTDVTDKYDEIGIPYIVECNSRESSPLGAVEWVKLWGAIMGMNDEAKAFFDEQVAAYEAVANLEKVDKVAVGIMVGSTGINVYYDSTYYGALIDQAGSNYVLSKEPEEEGTISYKTLGFEEFYALCKDVDYIFCNNYQKFKSLDDVLEYNELFEDFKAVQEGHVYTFTPAFLQATASVANAISDIRSVMLEPETANDTLCKIG